MRKTSISAENLTSYHEANYHVYFAPNFILKIGVLSKPLPKIYKKFNQKHAAFLTAYNPFSQKVTLIQNENNNKALENILISKGYSYILGEGICAGNVWPGEKSFLVLGMDLLTATNLGNQFKQNAILWIDSDTIPKLILLK